MDWPPQHEQSSTSEDEDPRSQEDSSEYEYAPGREGSPGQQDDPIALIADFFALMYDNEWVWDNPYELARAVRSHFGEYSPDIAGGCLWLASQENKINARQLMTVLRELISDPKWGAAAIDVVARAWAANEIEVAELIIAMLTEDAPHVAGQIVALKFKFQAETSGSVDEALALLNYFSENAALGMLEDMLSHQEVLIAPLMLGVRVIYPGVYEQFFRQLNFEEITTMVYLLAEQIDPTAPYPLMAMIREFLAVLDDRGKGGVLAVIAGHSPASAVALLGAMPPQEAGKLFGCMMHFVSGGVMSATRVVEVAISLLHALWSVDHVLARVCFTCMVDMKADSWISFTLFYGFLVYRHLNMVADLLAHSAPAVVSELLVEATAESVVGVYVGELLVSLLGENDAGVSLTMDTLRHISPAIAAQLEMNHPELRDL